MSRALPTLHFSYALGALAALLLFPAPIEGQAKIPPPPGPAAAPVSITLQEAIRRAEANEPVYAAAAADRGVAAADRNIARSGLLPNVIYHNQALYTQPNGAINQGGQIGNQAAPIFIANNAVHEYASQASITETFGLKQFADLKAADANAARASAELEIARRGLVATVVGLFYSVNAAQQKLAITQRALDESNDFTSLTQKREQAREAAHADVVRAQLQQQQRTRELSDARLAAGKASLELGVLLFPDPRTPFVTQAADDVTPLPTRDQVEAQAAANSAEMKSAIAVLHQADSQVTSARAGYLPDVGLNLTYGLDAPQFAKNGPDNTHNVGYSASVTVDIPVWDWFATQQRVKQSQLRRDAARVALTAAQRRLIAALEENYDEASAAHDQLASLHDSVNTAAESLRLTRLRYTSGEATVLEVVDAEAAMVTTETALEDGAIRYRIALANLQTLTGTL